MFDVGDDLDIQCAELMGWHGHTNPKYWWADVVDGVWATHWCQPGALRCSDDDPIFRPSSFIDHAWVLITHWRLRSDGHCVGVNDDNDRRGCSACFSIDTDDITKPGDSFLNYAPTVPHAICLAFLRANGVDVE